MRIAGKAAFLTLTVLVITVAAATGTVRAAPGGVTVAPAAIRLELAKGQETAAASFTLTNNYKAAVALGFSLERSAQQPHGTTDVLPRLKVQQTEAVVAPGETFKQVVTIHDSVSVTPGSQSADLVISHRGTAGPGVGVVPGMRLPVTIIKQDGAVTSLGLASITGPRLAMGMPREATVSLRNTGNMVAIPRGVVTVRSPEGGIIGKGTLNEPSKAVAPGATIALTVPITPLGNTAMPGTYHIIVQYGLGGDAPVSTGTARFFYIAWWHIAALATVIAIAWAVYKYADKIRLVRRPKKNQAPPKRPLLIGRDIT